MKKKVQILLVCNLVLFASSLIAQPVLTATGVNPVPGDVIVGRTTNYFNPGPSGAGVTWNISGGSGSPVTYNFVTVGSTPYGSLFPSATVSLDKATGESYFATSSTALQNYGYISSSVSVFEKSYTDPEDLLHFPFTFGNTYSDNFSCSWDTASVLLGRKGTTTVTADGYGTLIIPSGTFLNVTRVHFVQTYKDTIASSGYVVNYSSDQYLWYADGYHFALARTSVLNDPLVSGMPDSTGFYFGNPMSINDNPNGIVSFELYPNPAVDQITVDFTLTENKRVTIQVFNPLGQKMDINQSAEGFQGTNTIQLDVATLPEGIYFAQILLEGNTAATKRFVVAK